VVPQEIDIAPEGFDLVNGGRIFTPFVGEDPTIVKPGIWGGANWPPSAYDPRAQTLFVCASSVAGGFTGGGDPILVPPVEGGRYTQGNALFTRLPRTGVIAAMDMTTNTVVWRYRWPEQCYSGTLATGGGLLFVGRNDGRLTALDSRTGRQLWEFQTGAGMHAPVSTFVRDGRQYVLAYSAGNALIGSARGDSVWLFGLEGTLPPVEPGTPVSRLAPALPTTTSTAPTESSPLRDAMAPVAGAATPTQTNDPPAAASSDAEASVENGQRLFAETCVICHGEDGRGGHGGGAPLDTARDAATVISVVTDGRNAMPPFATVLTPEQISDLAAYVTRRLALPAQ
jgi:alcohol dehydrogenase (cytochrome c)